MSDYTMTVYELEQNNFDFGLQDYPIFDEDYRPLLNDAILSHYRFREIGFQNPYLWRERLRTRLNIIMRNKYNQLYEIKKTEFNPLYNIEITETFEHKIDSDSESTNTTNEKSNSNVNNDILALTSQFPSEEMTENDLTKNIYVDNANKNKTIESSNNDLKSDTNSINKGNMNESYTKRTEGSSAGLPFSKAMLQFKEYVMKFNIDQMVIDELKDLFMNIW